MNADLKGWPEYEEYYTSGYVKHHHLTHVVRKAMAQMNQRDFNGGKYDSYSHPSCLWVMSKPNQSGDMEEAILIGAFRVKNDFTDIRSIMRWTQPAMRTTFTSVTVRLPKERRNRKNAQTLNYCEEAIRELMVWNKMETT